MNFFLFYFGSKKTAHIHIYSRYMNAAASRNSGILYKKKSNESMKRFYEWTKKKILAIYTFIWITSVCVFVRTHVWQEYIIIVVIFFSLCAFVQKNLNQPFLYVCLKIWKRARERETYTRLFFQWNNRMIFFILKIYSMMMMVTHSNISLVCVCVCMWCARIVCPSFLFSLIFNATTTISYDRYHF